MNYDIKNYVDIHKLRGKYAKATGLHNTFSGQKNSTSNISSANAADSYAWHEVAWIFQTICWRAVSMKSGVELLFFMMRDGAYRVVIELVFPQFECLFD